MALVINHKVDGAVFIVEQTDNDYVLSSEVICNLLSCNEEDLLLDGVTIPSVIIVSSRSAKELNDFATYAAGYELYGDVLMASGTELPDTDFFIKHKTDSNSLLQYNTFNDCVLSTLISEKYIEYSRLRKRCVVFDYDFVNKKTSDENFRLVMEVMYTVIVTSGVVTSETVLFENEDIYVVLGDDAKNQINLMIQYFEKTEEYERCAKLTGVKVI